MIREVGVKRFADDASDVAWLDPDGTSAHRSLAEKEQGGRARSARARAAPIT